MSQLKNFSMAIWAISENSKFASQFPQIYKNACWAYHCMQLKHDQNKQENINNKSFEQPWVKQ
jgi:hypothetical protein